MTRIPVLSQYRDINRHLAELQNAHNQIEARCTRMSLQLEGLIRTVERLNSELRAAPHMSLDRSGQPRRRLAFDHRDPPINGFSEVFRGLPADVQERQRIYLPLFAGRKRVADIGCGRGDFLALLGSIGADAIGIDQDPVCVREAQRDGHNVVEADGTEWLARQPQGSLDGIFACHVVEHLPFTRLESFLAAASRALAPQGILVMETVNPHALFAFKTFWTDPTHLAPLFPEVLLTLTRLAGFARGEVQFPFAPPGTADPLADCGEYAVVAVVPGTSSGNRPKADMSAPGSG